ncbi:hypothetical protein ACQKWADRAFT_226413 [Trichoderma austrokoningii]
MQKISRHSDGIPTTHTSRSPSITQQTSQTSSYDPTRHCLSLHSSRKVYRGPIRALAAAHMRWWVVLHLGPPSFASFGGLTMPLPRSMVFDNAILRGPSNVLLRTRGPRARACSQFQRSLTRISGI